MSMAGVTLLSGKGLIILISPGTDYSRFMDMIGAILIVGWIS
jgi:hypothetical protein